MGASLSSNTSRTASSIIKTIFPGIDKISNFLNSPLGIFSGREQLDIKTTINADGDITYRTNIHPEGTKAFDDFGTTYKFTERNIEAVASANPNDGSCFTTAYKDFNYVHLQIRNAEGKVITTLDTSRFIYEAARGAVKLFTGKDMDDGLITKADSRGYDNYLKFSNALGKSGIPVNAQDILINFGARQDFMESMDVNHASSENIMVNVTEANLCDSVAKVINKSVEGMHDVRPISSFDVSLNMHKANSTPSENAVSAMTAGANQFSMRGLSDLRNPEEMAIYINRLVSGIDLNSLSSDSMDTILAMGAIVEKTSDGSYSFNAESLDMVSEIADSVGTRMLISDITNQDSININDEGVNSESQMQSENSADDFVDNLFRM